MRDCDSFRGLIPAFLDGELVGEDCAAFEAHIRICGACRAALAEERAVVVAVQEALPLYQAPPRLRDTVAQVMDAGRPRRRSVSRAGLAAGLAALALSVAGTFWLVRRPTATATEPAPASELATRAAQTHLRYSQGRLPLEVVSDKPEQVSRWFSGRVPFHLALPDYPVGPGVRKPYQLAGGRLVSFKDDTAAFVAYRMAGRPISLFVTSAGLVRPSGGEIVVSGNLKLHVESVDGLKVITWTHNGLTYALASDLDGEGSRSCLVCHGDPAERHKLEPLARAPLTD